MDLPAFDLRLLGAFSVVAEELHFGRAAALLGMAQPKLSQQIGRLERQLDTRLLDRRGGRIALTPVGTAVLTECRAILARAGSVEATLRHDRAALRSHLGDAMHPVVATAVAAFADAHPAVELHISQGSISDATRALAEGRVGVGLDQPGGTPQGCSAAVLDSRPLGVVCPPGHRLARHPTADWTDLEGESVIAAPPGIGDAWNELVRAALRRAGVSTAAVVGPRVNSNLYLGPLITGSGALLLCTEDFHRPMPPGLEWRPLLPEEDMAIAVIWDDRTADATVHRFVERTTALALARARRDAGPVDAVSPT